jgi:3-phosphoshikimate 1-carboxyvinyltransferase
MAEGRSVLGGALESEDTQVMVESLHRLGIAVDVRGDTFHVAGGGAQLATDHADLFVGNSGTTMRFLTAVLAAYRGRFRLDGVPRMRERPIGDLLAALRQLGGRAESEGGNDCPPIIVQAAGLEGGTARVRGDISSQFLSGLLLACPYARRDVTLIVDGELVSQPYVRMTIGVMAAFGVCVESQSLSQFVIRAGQRYRGRDFAVEPDASAASYFWGAAAITGGRATVAGLTTSSLQGDVMFVECLRRMGCEVQHSETDTTVIGRDLQGIDVDMNAISDTVQTLAAVALFARGPTTIRGVAHIRHKETDRIGDLARELRKFGATVEEFPDGLRIHPGPLQGAVVETYNDHRMAMSLALPGLRVPGVIIRNPACTAKTYPRFFEELQRLRHC